MKIALSRSLVVAVAASLTLSLLVLAKNGYIFPRRAGSFEYVRKGEALLEKGDFAAAVRFFEKAHEESPQNKAIAEDLVYAYAKYGSQFADKGKYGDAVSYMLKARHVIESVYTMQNLALTYARKAIAEALREEWRDALESFENARLAAEDSAHVSKNLGISLHNDAVAQFKAGRERLALILLKQAALINDDSHIYAFLGDIYYKLADMDKAVFYYSKALALAPDDNDIAERCRKVSREIELSRQAPVGSIPHFDVLADEAVPFDAPFVSGVLEKAYHDVGSDLGYFPPSRTVVRFYEKNNFSRIFEMPALVRAFYDGTIRIPMPQTALDRKELASHLYHEYTHAVLSAVTNNSCPPWLGEGIAVWEEVRWTRQGANIAIADKALSGRDVSIQALSDAFRDKPAEKADAQLYYILAYTLVDYITRTWGLGGLRDALRRIGDGRHAVNAIDEEFMVSEKRFDALWNEFLRARYVRVQ